MYINVKRIWFVSIWQQWAFDWLIVFDCDCIHSLMQPFMLRRCCTHLHTNTHTHTQMQHNEALTNCIGKWKSVNQWCTHVAYPAISHTHTYKPMSICLHEGGHLVSESISRQWHVNNMRRAFYYNLFCSVFFSLAFLFKSRKTQFSF